MRKNILSLICAIFTIATFAQNYSAKIIDKDTKQPVAFAAIQTGEYKGVISNEEGVFNIDLEKNTVKEITISCLGYETKSIQIDAITKDNFTIHLVPAINELNTVFLSNTKPNVDSIISRSIKNFKRNHITENIRTHQIFHRETAVMDFKKLEFEIKKASHVRKKQLKGVNNELEAMSNEVMTSNLMHFQDFTGDLSVSHELGYKFKADKAIQVINSKKDFSLDNIQDKAQNIILKYLDTTLTYKLKSGLFKVEDSLSLAESDDNDDKQEFTNDHLKSKAYGMFEDTGNKPKSLLKGLLNLEYYEYYLREVTSSESQLIYVIDYKPRKSRAKYTGTLYIADESYAVLKADYKYGKGKRGEKLNLRLVLGVKYIENQHNGVMLFRKNENNTYEPRYLKEVTGRYFYINRPIKFIENSSARRKTAFNFKIEGTALQKEELLFTDSKTITKDALMAIKEPKAIPYQKQRRYDASVWGTNETLVPTTDLKTFDADKN